MYKTGSDKYADLVIFDDNVIVEGTKGKMVASSAKGK